MPDGTQIVTFGLATLLVAIVLTDVVLRSAPAEEPLLDDDGSDV